MFLSCKTTHIFRNDRALWTLFNKKTAIDAALSPFLVEKMFCF